MVVNNDVSQLSRSDGEAAVVIRIQNASGHPGLVGTGDYLGAWGAGSPVSAVEVPEGSGTWEAAFKAPYNTLLEFKCVEVDGSNSIVSWESGGENRKIAVADADLLVQVTWGNTADYQLLPFPVVKDSKTKPVTSNIPPLEDRIGSEDLSNNLSKDKESNGVSTSDLNGQISSKASASPADERLHPPVNGSVSEGIQTSSVTNMQPKEEVNDKSDSASNGHPAGVQNNQTCTSPQTIQSDQLKELKNEKQTGIESLHGLHTDQPQEQQMEKPSCESLGENGENLQTANEKKDNKEHTLERQKPHDPKVEVTHETERLNVVKADGTKETNENQEKNIQDVIGDRPQDIRAMSNLASQQSKEIDEMLEAQQNTTSNKEREAKLLEPQVTEGVKPEVVGVVKHEDIKAGIPQDDEPRDLKTAKEDDVKSIKPQNVETPKPEASEAPKSEELETVKPEQAEVEKLQDVDTVKSTDTEAVNVQNAEAVTPPQETNADSPPIVGNAQEKVEVSRTQEVEVKIPETVSEKHPMKPHPQQEAQESMPTQDDIPAAVSATADVNESVPAPQSDTVTVRLDVDRPVMGLLFSALLVGFLAVLIGFYLYCNNN